MSRPIKDYRIIDNGIWIPLHELERLQIEKIQADEMAELIKTYKTDWKNLKPDLKKYAKELQEELVQHVIEYVHDHNLTDIWSLSFSVDDIQSSVRVGHWYPSSDSHIGMETLGENGRTLVAEYY